MAFLSYQDTRISRVIDITFATATLFPLLIPIAFFYYSIKEHYVFLMVLYILIVIYFRMNVAKKMG